MPDETPPSTTPGETSPETPPQEEVKTSDKQGKGSSEA